MIRATSIFTFLNFVLLPIVISFDCFFISLSSRPYWPRDDSGGEPEEMSSKKFEKNQSTMM
jgi:hypothetical protein